MDDDNKQVAIREQSLTLPITTGDGMAGALASYKEIQQALDRSMPDQLQNIRGKVFRKKGYWRAVSVAFGLCVEQRKEEQIKSDSGDWGYIVTYRATAPNGKYADGDGACTASEKADGQDTIHNVRSHAQTRAYNRAVSNLVGFGEVSADEVSEGRSRPMPQAPRPTTKSERSQLGLEILEYTHNDKQKASDTLFSLTGKRTLTTLNEIEAASARSALRHITNYPSQDDDIPSFAANDHD